MASPVITLTTDFGAADGFVGAMKGVVLGINPGATIVDLVHEVPPQDVAHGAFVLAITSPYFGPDAIHVAVVDPGVGTPRQVLLLVEPAGRFVAPDNGLLTYVFADSSPLVEQENQDRVTEAAVPRKIAVPEGWRAYDLDRPEYWRHPVSDTFHGRDVFAPVAAQLSLGASPDDMGSRVMEVGGLVVRPPSLRGEALHGMFTTSTASTLESAGVWFVDLTGDCHDHADMLEESIIDDGEDPKAHLERLADAIERANSR